MKHTKHYVLLILSAAAFITGAFVYSAIPDFHQPPIQQIDEHSVIFQPPVEFFEDNVQSSYYFNIFGDRSPMMNDDIIAFYGNPNSRAMGIIGQYSLENLEPLLTEFAATYDNANGNRGVIPALYLIYGTCWPEGEIGYLKEKQTIEYIEYALERGWLVFLDHQIGKYTIEYAMSKLLPYLKYPNVHLALDPEWRTTKPMQKIGAVTGPEINIAQQIMNDYIEKHNLPGKRSLVIHQFRSWMIPERDMISTQYPKIDLIHCADGFGPPALKRETYRYNALAKNIPLKSFKLFSKPAIDGAGFDEPLMSPEEVLALDPRPYLIMIQ